MDDAYVNLDDYISREAAILTLLEKGQSSRRYKLGQIWELNFSEIREAIATIPAADVRPVVPCRDCRWWTKQEKSLQGRCELGGFYPTGGWFCANGERATTCGADMQAAGGDH